MSFKSNYKLNLLLITILGFIARLLWVVNIDAKPVSDFAAYQSLAISIFNNEQNNFLGFQGPGYPLALGWFYKIIGNTNISSAKIFNIILSVITMIVMLKIITTLFTNKKLIYISYAIVVFLPTYVAYNNILATEPLYLFLFSIIVCLQVSGKDSLWKFALLGIFIGLISLVKPYMIVYPVIAAVAYYLKNKEIKKAVMLFATAQVLCICVIAPWTLRNYRMHNDFVPIAYNNGYVMYINNNDQNKGGWMSIANVKMTEETKARIIEEGYTYEEAISSFNTKLNKVFKEEAMKWIKKNPGKFSILALKRVAATFFVGAYDIFEWSMNGENSNNILYLIVNSFVFKFIANSAVILLSLCGIIFIGMQLIPIIKAFFNKRGTIEYTISIPIFNIVFAIMLSIVYEGQPRYNFATLSMAAICLCMMMSKSKRFEKYIKIKE